MGTTTHNRRNHDPITSIGVSIRDSPREKPQRDGSYCEQGEHRRDGDQLDLNAGGDGNQHLVWCLPGLHGVRVSSGEGELCSRGKKPLLEGEEALDSGETGDSRPFSVGGRGGYGYDAPG